MECTRLDTNFLIFLEVETSEERARTQKKDLNVYPFGLKHKGYNNTVVGRDHMYGFGGKEEQSELGLDWIDITARNYDPALGRWMNLDPMAAERDWLSPYNFVQNNPVLRVDPTGLLDDYGIDKDGYLFLVNETGDDFDRIVKTDSEGNAKIKGEGFLGFLVSESEKGKTKVAVDNISKGILDEGINLRLFDGNFDVNGEGQPSLAEFDKFISEFSDYVGKEIAGVRLGESDTEEVNKVTTYKYIENTRTESRTPLSWFTEFGDKLKGHFHTHPYGDHTPSDNVDVPLRNKYPNLPFSIIAGGYEEKY